MSSHLTQQIEAALNQNLESEQSRQQKFSLIDEVQNHLAGKFTSSAKLYMTGSSFFGLSTSGSDLDCVLIGKSLYTETSALRTVSTCLRSCGGFYIKEEVFKAKVPRLLVVHTSTGTILDMTVNKSHGPRAAHMMKCYMKLDKRLKPLLFIVKLWAKKNGINNAQYQTLSSFSYFLMVIHYLQYGCEPKVLPSLQDLMPGVFESTNLNDFNQEHSPPEFSSRNEQSLGELLIGFFKYYKDFNYSTDAISVRLGTTIDKKLSRHFVDFKGSRYRLCIEEPFDRFNTASSVWNATGFSSIMSVIERSYTRLMNNNDLTSIGV